MGDRRPIELEAGWGKMQMGVAKLKRILEGEDEPQFDADLYMQLYTIIYNMCTQKPPHDYSEQLYNRYRDVFCVYINESVIPALKDHREDRLLGELHRRWNNHQVMTRWLSRFFNYLDRYYISRHSLDSLSNVGLICFRDQVYSDVKRRARDALLTLIDKEREGEKIDNMLVKNVLDIYIRVGMETMDKYENDFEKDLLVATAAYYKRKAAVWVAEDSCPDYMLKAEACLRQEEERVGNYLHISTKPKLLEQVENEVLRVYQQQLLEKENSGVSALLRDDKKEDLGRMYRLFSRISGGLDPVAAAFRKHVEADGMTLVRDADAAAAAKKDAGKKKPMAGTGDDAEQSFVRQVVALHDKYRLYVEDCFSNASLFHKALKEAFEAFCNKQIAGATMAQLMADYCNTLLKKGGAEKLGDEAIGVMLDKVIKLLAYLNDKDLFAEFYRKRLSRRLLQDKIVEHHEMQVLAQLKAQCGAQFTGKMEGMVNDLQLARDNQQAFEEWCQGQANSGSVVDITVSVLTTGYWPSYKTLDLTLPQEMIDALSQFKGYYDDKTKNRKLQWIYSLGHVTIKFTPSDSADDNRTYDLMCSSTFHAAVLLQFNEAATLKVSDIQERLTLPVEDLSRVLHSLSGTKNKILLRLGDAKGPPTINDTYKINTDFKSTMRRIKIQLPVITDDKKKVVEDVSKERTHAVDAAIVRTMKSRKRLGLTQIISEVVQQLSKMFQADVRMIKKQVESLIDREYLKRDEDNPNMFLYLA
mmetsp:Transcript_15091/g.45575  ORF Transcript_15091/g.45575 Transcript_15091/m.45575 type:complete len:755 (-) Transcript_15091:786-3050(-)